MFRQYVIVLIRASSAAASLDASTSSTFCGSRFFCAMRRTFCHKSTRCLTLARHRPAQRWVGGLAGYRRRCSVWDACTAAGPPCSSATIVAFCSFFAASFFASATPGNRHVFLQRSERAFNFQRLLHFPRLRQMMPPCANGKLLRWAALSSTSFPTS